MLKLSMFPRFCSLIGIGAFVLALGGCAAFQPDPQQVADQKESMLAAAGFKMLPAETPEKLAHAQSLPQLKVKYFTDSDGAVRYWFADAQFCRCVYVGDQAAYQKFKQMQFQAQLASEQNQAAQMQAEAAQEEQMELIPWHSGFRRHSAPHTPWLPCRSSTGE